LEALISPLEQILTRRAVRTMSKRVILITGTPCVGKTTVAKLLASKLNALYINLTDLAISENLVLGKDKQRKTVIVDEGKMKRKIRKIIKQTEKNDTIIDGHYAASVVPKELASHIFVLRRDPVELKKIMKKCGYSERKLTENLASEILDVCLVEALNVKGSARVCEIDVTGKSPENLLKEMLAILHDNSKCCVGIVDWLGKLEAQGLTDEYLKI
jgi:adenylate kinase